MVTDPIAINGNKVTAVGQCRYSAPLATAAMVYVRKTAACKRNVDFTALGSTSRGPDPQWWWTNPENKLVMVPVMYVVAMPGRFKRLTAALCSPMASPDTATINVITTLFSSGTRRTAGKMARIMVSTSTARRTRVHLFGLPPSPTSIAPMTIPATNASNATTECTASVLLPCPAAIPSSTALPVMLAVNTCPVRYMVASTLPAAQVNSSTVIRR